MDGCGMVALAASSALVIAVACAWVIVPFATRAANTVAIGFDGVVAAALLALVVALTLFATCDGAACVIPTVPAVNASASPVEIRCDFFIALLFDQDSGPDLSYADVFTPAWK
jgi:hypothetical protein